MKIGGFELGAHTLVIAEVGSNHCGDVDLARQTLLAAAESGADVVKFQMYDPEKLVEPTAPVLSYITQSHRSQRERFRSLSLPRGVFVELADLARQAGVGFLVTPFDEDAVDFLDSLVPAFKVASGDLTNLRLLKAVASRGKPVLLSTGMATLEEIDRATAEVPKDRLVLLHCIGAYPTPDEEVNLETIRLLRDRFRVPVGWSDHTHDCVAAVAAVAVGAQLVEKHFILSKNLPAADVELSADPTEFRDMVQTIRRVETMRGGAWRHTTPSEQYFREKLRRAVYARQEIPAGTSVTEEMVIPLRPCGADMLPANEIDEVVGKVVCRTILRETPIRRSDFVD